MLRLVVWDALEHRHATLLQELAGRRDIDLTWTRDPYAFEAAALGGRNAVALILLRSSPTERLIGALDRVAPHVPTAALLGSATSGAMRTLLEHGVREVFAAPITSAKLMTGLTAMRGVRPASLASTPLSPVDPTACSVKVFGGDELHGHWTAVAPGVFEITTTPGHVSRDAMIEVIGPHPGLHGAAGVFGRVMQVAETPGGPLVVRCEALPVGDRPALALSRSVTPRPADRDEPVSLVAPAERLRITFDPAILGGLVVVLLVATGLGWMAVARNRRVDVAPEPASTEAVMDGIREAF